MANLPAGHEIDRAEALELLESWGIEPDELDRR